MDRTPWLDKETGKAQKPGRSKYSSLQVTTGTTSKDVLEGCLIMRRPFLPTSSEQASRHEDTRTGMGLASQTDRQTASAAEDSKGSSSSYWAETCEVGEEVVSTNPKRQPKPKLLKPTEAATMRIHQCSQRQRPPKQMKGMQ